MKTTPGAMRAAAQIVSAVQTTFKQLGYTKPEKPETVQALTEAFAVIIDRETDAEYQNKIESLERQLAVAVAASAQP